MRRRVLSSSAALCLALGGALTACGGGSGSAASGAAVTSRTGGSSGTATSPVRAIEAAYTSTTNVGSMRFSMDGAMSSSGMDMKITASGVEDVATKQADITMTVPIVGSMEVRVVDGVGYVRMGSAAGGKWMKAPATASGSGGLTSGSGYDAGEVLGFLKSVSAKGVTDLGAATVRATSTTHYRATLDLAKVAAAAGAATGSGSSSSADLGSMMKSTGLTSMPMDVYVDGQHHVRRVAMTMTMGGAATGSSAPANPLTGSGTPSGQFTMTMDFYDFGVPVHVTAPPADQIVDSSSLLNGMGVGTAG